MISENIKNLKANLEAKDYILSALNSAYSEKMSDKPALNQIEQYLNNIWSVGYEFEKLEDKLKSDIEWRKNAKGWEDTTAGLEKALEIILNNKELKDKLVKEKIGDFDIKNTILYKALYNRDDISLEEFAKYFTITKRKTTNLQGYGNDIVEYEVKPRYPKIFDFMPSTHDRYSDRTAEERVKALYKDFQSGKNETSNFNDYEATKLLNKMARQLKKVKND